MFMSMRRVKHSFRNLTRRNKIHLLSSSFVGIEFNTMQVVTDDEENKKQGYTHRMMAPVANMIVTRSLSHARMAVVLSLTSELWIMPSKPWIHSNHFCDGIAGSALRLLGSALPAGKSRCPPGSGCAPAMPGRCLAIYDSGHRRRTPWKHLIMPSGTYWAARLMCLTVIALA